MQETFISPLLRGSNDLFVPGCSMRATRMWQLCTDSPALKGSAAQFSLFCFLLNPHYSLVISIVTQWHLWLVKTMWMGTNSKRQESLWFHQFECDCCARKKKKISPVVITNHSWVHLSWRSIKITATMSGLRGPADFCLLQQVDRRVFIMLLLMQPSCSNAGPE